MTDAQPEVPAEVENYLIGLGARAGQMGGAIGLAAAGPLAGPGAGAGAARGGARGGARGAARLRTKVEERTGDVPGTADQAAARLRATFPRAEPLPATGRVRLAVPVGATGLQQIILDAEFSPAGDATVHVRLRGFGKEGLISRKPTRTVTDQAGAAVLNSQRAAGAGA
jgi:hypothetical protein